MSDAPEWFWQAIDQKPAAGTVEVEDSDINYLTWGNDADADEPNTKPGILFVHGHNAHAHWWDFIAPAFLDKYQVAAVDLSGMGDSDHRDEYQRETWAKEILTVADETKLPKNTVVVAHSFGGLMALRACNVAPERFSGLVLVDTGVRSPEEEEARDKDKQVPRLARPKIYPTQEVAMSRFRLQPPQQCENQYIVSHIARNSVEYDDEGWVWKFDEELNMRVKPIEGLKEDLVGLSINVALIYGELSESFSAQSAEHMKSLKPELEVIEMKDAQHHLFLDQPLDFISKLSGVLDRWGS